LDSCGFDMFLSNVINLLHLEKKEWILWYL
jgi:hypothetical protein